MKRPKRDPWAGRCRSCGGSKFVKAVDNLGNEYEGCATCVIQLPAFATLEKAK